ncbi:hypothetical protein ARHIZOSPH14_06650 [Agromyces rhizosphaerae]|uniref:Alpha/beta hydrolase n=1 Tax=Agromyces rhizosphaerae TaxID=88374 RepID=A0A9W6CYY9_9MICO|nr:hypothetical protein [Agromyces rhizosphaerae]GLI26423.1 hypothetical protein ARHIZOSPH14_06650 [Agromyces rhizosphaerae]
MGDGRVLLPIPDRPQYFALVDPAGSNSRLVVFVHGFNGKPVGTWRRFDDGSGAGAWWSESDAVFIGYDSLRREVGSVADEVLAFVRAAMLAGPLPGIASSYRELVLVGHSLGGVVVRSAVQLALRERRMQHVAVGAGDDAVLDARVVLFSPATSGFGPKGLLGLARATSIWLAVNPLLKMSPAFHDLNRDTVRLDDLRHETEAAARSHPGLRALRPDVLWADPDHVVYTDQYSTDPPPRWARRRSHSNVCKPAPGRYETPWRFVESGTAR